MNKFKQAGFRSKFLEPNIVSIHFTQFIGQLPLDHLLQVINILSAKIDFNHCTWPIYWKVVTQPWKEKFCMKRSELMHYVILYY